jgi:hypothetical protein
LLLAVRSSIRHGLRKLPIIKDCIDLWNFGCLKANGHIFCQDAKNGREKLVILLIKRSKFYWRIIVFCRNKGFVGCSRRRTKAKDKTVILKINNTNKNRVPRTTPPINAHITVE